MAYVMPPVTLQWIYSNDPTVPTKNVNTTSLPLNDETASSQTLVIPVFWCVLAMNLCMIVLWGF
jgi:hypothetical protein